ncbi:MAG: hypothetical protein AAGJ82_08600 [Bacteroidota bacterium]
MNTPDHQWEADLRRTVEQHEFDFDPQAWAAMEQLLDANAGDIPSDSGKHWTAAKWWKWLLMGIAIGLGFFWLTKPTVTTPPALSSFSVQTRSNEPSPALTDARTDSSTLVQTPRVPTRPPSVPPPVANVDVVLDSTSNLPATPGKVTPLRPTPRVVAPLPSDNRIPLLTPKDRNPDFRIQTSPPQKRRRNRWTLFPDVFPNY